MRKLLITFAFCLSMVAKAQDSCLIQLMVAPMEQKESMPQTVIDMLEARLIHILTSAYDIAVSKEYGQFFISGKMVNIEKELSGTKIVAHATLMLYIGDVNRKLVFSSESFDVIGIGNTEELALTSSIKNIKNNKKFRAFVTQGKEKIIDYFDKNYKQYLDSALLADKKGNYEEALYYSTMIPSKSKGYVEAKKTTDRIVKKCDTSKSAVAIGRDWNKKQERPRPIINLIKYK